MIESLSDVHAALAQRGFVHDATVYDGKFVYRGEIVSSIGAIQVEIEIASLDDIPKIRLLEIPHQFKSIEPHIGVNGGLCYAAKGSIAFDIFSPASQILACLDRATFVLDQILSGERVHDLADEFYVYWSSQDFCFVDIKNIQSQYITAGIVTNKDGKETLSIILSESIEDTKKKLAAIGCGANTLPCGACVISTKAEPTPILIPDQWPPRKVSELLAWQHQLDPNSARKILLRLHKFARQGYKNAVVLFVSPTSQYAAGIVLNNTNRKNTNGKTMRIQEAIYTSEVMVLNTVRMDDHYIVERNQPGRNSLMGKKIILIGCGTIGGYLADLLVKSGAGMGGGELLLVDSDVMSPGNVGRHRLGFNRVFENKAEALASEIIRTMPSVNVMGHKVEAKEMNLDSFDIVINASGEQVLSDALSLKVNQNKFTPILHCWIEGPGIGVRSMLQDGQGVACYRCLCDENRQPLYPATTELYPIKMAGQGCESLYVPFPASASVFAAALALEHVLDWVNGHPEPRLRTMIINQKYQSDHLNVNPIKLTQCPACAL